VLILLLIYLLFLRKVYSLQSSKKVIQKLFDSGFWLGILYIIEPFSLLFSIIIFAAILLHQKITIHTLITPITGFITPLITYFAYLFWNNSIEGFTQLFYFDEINNISIYSENYIFGIFGIITLLTILSILLKSPRALSVNNAFKKSWLLLIVNAIIATAFAFIVTKKNGSEIVFLLVPSSINIANGFEVVQKKTLKYALFVLLLISTVVTFFFL